MSHIIGRGRYAREAYPTPSFPAPLDPRIAVLTAILEHNVQLQGPSTAVSGTVVAFDSGLYTLVPGITIFPGTPTVEVTGSLTVSGTPGDNVLFELVRDRDGALGPATVLTHQEVTIGGTTGDLASCTLVSLDPGLVEGSTHIWSIRATQGAGILPVGADDGLILLEQKPSGTSVTIPTPPTQVVNLRTAGDFAAFAGTGITNVGGSTVDGDIGTSPAVTHTAITGFALVLDGSGQFSTSSQVHPGTPAAPYPAQPGHVFAFDYAVPTPAKCNQANLDMITAYNDAAGRPPTTTSAGADIGGTTLHVGTGAVFRYTGATTVTAGPLTIDSATPGAVAIIQIAGTFDVHHDILLTGTMAGHPENVFFVVAGQVTFITGTMTTANGEFLGQTGIAMQTGITLNGRALAQTLVTIDHNTIVET